MTKQAWRDRAEAAPRCREGVTEQGLCDGSASP